MRISDAELSRVTTDFSAIRKDIDSIKQGIIEDCEGLDYKLLTSSREIDWDAIKIMFRKEAKYFENVLFKIHLKRKEKYEKWQRANILMFLSIGYHYSRDVRYFNEFLWFYHQNDDFLPLWLLNIDNFFGNLKETRHYFPLSDHKGVQEFAEKVVTVSQAHREQKPDTSLRIGLLGSPTFFPVIHQSLVSEGFHVSCFFPPFHPDKKINFILNNKVLFKLLCLLKKVGFEYEVINYHYKDDRIHDLLKNSELDIGFHKLGFIIKNNIIDAFKIGLINDHWGILPFLRGRSTIEYSLLFGFPLAVTTHFVDESVDSGDIINIYEYKDIEKKYSTVRQIRNHIRQDMARRAIDSIKVVTRVQRETYKNETERGLTLYSMHPSLIKFIEKNILAYN